MILLAVPLMHGQDLSKYRSFSFGMSVSDIAKQIAKTPADATVVHQRPALIQQLTWWPPASLLANPLQSEAVQSALSFTTVSSFGWAPPMTAPP
jgi:hypothetical protein